MPVLPALPYKLIGMAAGALAVLAFVMMAFHWKAQAADRKEQLATICQATRDASGQAKLKCSEVPKQIRFMGQAIGTLTTAIHKQNAAVDAMGKKSAADQALAKQASQAAQERARAAEATAERLRASARSTVPSRGCEASKAVQESWR